MAFDLVSNRGGIFQAYPARARRVRLTRGNGQYAQPSPLRWRDEPAPPVRGMSRFVSRAHGHGAACAKGRPDFPTLAHRARNHCN
ncbi:hypothetical protein BJA5080_05537 [Bradyrhizobium diazoefficiens SEMIA 5080]|uniref:Uncharacterized protein n=1 Tax=Bradyrhizobium diazoefficiens SEMIA 5080 TaxID=754504 RepID=A0A837C3G0_9BRAD|nr:hypothetical protein BJA5080_05537 [Bradyrhizobium diazoefficiens SEMIA 5080]